MRAMTRVEVVMVREVSFGILSTFETPPRSVATSRTLIEVNLMMEYKPGISKSIKFYDFLVPN